MTYSQRNAIERCPGYLKHHRGLPTRYDKLAVHLQTTARVAAINRWLRRLT